MEAQQKRRYVNKTDKGGDGSTPGLAGLCVPTIAKLPANFVSTIMKIKASTFWLLCAP